MYPKRSFQIFFVLSNYNVFLKGCKARTLQIYDQMERRQRIRSCTQIEWDLGGCRRYLDASTGCSKSYLPHTCGRWCWYCLPVVHTTLTLLFVCYTSDLFFIPGMNSISSDLRGNRKPYFQQNYPSPHKSPIAAYIHQMLLYAGPLSIPRALL